MPFCAQCQLYIYIAMATNCVLSCLTTQLHSKSAFQHLKFYHFPQIVGLPYIKITCPLHYVPWFNYCLNTLIVRQSTNAMDLLTYCQ